jgi:hypothetical protein
MVADASGSIRRSIRIVVRVRLVTVKTLKTFWIQTGEVNYTSRKVVSMAKSAPITIPTEPICNIPRPVDLIERVAKGDREDPSLAPRYDDAIRDTIERFETTGSPASLAGSEASRRGTTP